MPKKTVTPLRYPGGKTKLIKYTTDLLKANNLVGCTYIEPFAGGAGLALELLLTNKVSKVILNDIDPSVYAFWYSILNNADELISKIESTPITIDEWRTQKEIQGNKNAVSVLELGYSTLFLNRTNRSGIINAGPIGGKNQNGNYKLDCRFNKADIIERIKNINSRKADIQFYNMDASDFISNIIAPLKSDCFVFFDPPYHVKGPGLYLNHYNDEDHMNLSSVIKALDKHWILTYDNSDYIKSLYEGMKSNLYELQYSAQSAYKGTEFIVFSDKLLTLDIKKAY